ncbi:(2Fe-2S)-binding protein [Candidatus Sumerlaeota bacterium]|nr:(2Fe-2S)-binding protein [Candidatus Sumerlaeota bacterium]
MSPPVIELHLTVNGESRTFLTQINRSLFDVLRAEGYVDVKNGCLNGDCGSCAVLLNGRPVLGCLVMAPHCEGGEVVTAAGLGRPGDLHPLQEAFLDTGAVQCGFCTPGMLIVAKHLIDTNPDPSEEEIAAALAGNLCRCTGYVKIIDGVKEAARRMRASKARSKARGRRRS